MYIKPFGSINKGGSIHQGALRIELVIKWKVALLYMT